MTKGSDNDFPSILLSEQASAPTSPAAGKQRAYIRNSDHKLVTVNSSGTVAPVGGAGALVFLAAQTASASASLDFTTFISSTYDDYVFKGVNLVPATNGAILLAQIGTGGTPTYDTGTNYFTASGSSFGYRIASTVANAAGYGQASFSADLIDPQSTAQMKQMFGNAAWHDGSTVVGGSFSALWAVTTAATAIRFLFSTGNITSGIVRAYGVSKT